MLTLDHLRKISGRHLGDIEAISNMSSVLAGLRMRGEGAGLNAWHRLAHFVAQVAHESGRFRFDEEVWGKGGGTPAQMRYDTRTDLGNTPERDGDGFMFRGRTAMQITGRANTTTFRDWARTFARLVPDFEREPDAMLTDPWEGLGPIWYWETRRLNLYADRNHIETITRRINGGLNGYADRLALYTRTALVFLGRDPDDVRGYQSARGLTADGDAGPLTREALHKDLVAMAFAPPAEPAIIPPAPALSREADKLARIAAIVTEP